IYPTLVMYENGKKKIPKKLLKSSYVIKKVRVDDILWTYRNAFWYALKSQNQVHLQAYQV
ncbi:hypothetical protein, partial [Salmonella sp. S146_54837]|uniref:hypothetical protein n=1 Tax=Salmonella sp. S146_54837 TaxID=2665635 RepID=UPI001CA9B7BD